MPKGFPYFAVDFGNQGGFAHVIEDEVRFPYYFGKVKMILILVKDHLTNEIFNKESDIWIVFMGGIIRCFAAVNWLQI